MTQYSMSFLVKKKAIEKKLTHSNETILLVEDNEEIRKLAMEFLAKQGYKVLEACHGDDGLFICKQYQGPIHLMLTDVVLPGMNGQELAEHLLTLRPEMKVVYMSGYPIDTLTHRSVSETKEVFLQKPFKLNALVRKVREVLDSPG
jgi:two-component system cell cycle sensor histidine kinase/response regulator CckA